LSKKQDTTGGAPYRRRITATCAVSGLLLLGTIVATAGQAHAAGGFGAGLTPVMAPVQSKIRPTTAGLPDLSSFAPRLQGVRLASLGQTAAPDEPMAQLASNPSVGSGGLDSPRVSGLTWRSGASCGQDGFTGWRGRALDAHVGFVQHDTWERMFTYLRGGYFKSFVRRSPLVVVSMPMMPRSARRQHAACAAGQFDATFRQFGSLLTAAGAGRSIVRIGWEANIGSSSHPWGIDSTGDIANYKKCFQRIVSSLKSTAPGIKIEWTNAKKGSLSVSVMDTYPGDSLVDVIGVHYYDNRPKMNSEANWNAMYNATHNGGPMGIGQWLKAAQSRGKKLAVPEWGIWAVKGESSTQADDPVYIDSMHRFFRANGSAIAYENYYNCRDVHQIYPSNIFPKASSRYKALWASGG
jgi:hypothetical protein